MRHAPGELGARKRRALVGDPRAAVADPRLCKFRHLGGDQPRLRSTSAL